MYDLKKEILADFSRMAQEKNCRYSQIMRNIFQKYGEISPPIMAHYFEAIYSRRAMDFMPALGSWWHDATSDISDMEFDRLVGNVLEQHK